MYVEPNVKTKKELKERVARGETVVVYSPGFYPAKTDGEETVEGPHYPEPHRWYARVRVANGRVTKVLS